LEKEKSQNDIVGNLNRKIICKFLENKEIQHHIMFSCHCSAAMDWKEGEGGRYTGTKQGFL